MHWIMVGVLIGIGPMLASLVVRLGLWAIVALLPVALVGAAVSAD